MHPFNQRWQQGKNAVKAMSSNLAMVTKLARELYKPTDLNPKLDVVATEVKQADSLVSALATMLDCNAFHKQYVKAVDSVCDLGLRDYLQVDEQDPFLPPSAASQAIAARTLRSQGSYGSTGFFRSRNSSHHHTPPPTPPYPGTLYVHGSVELLTLLPQLSLDMFATCPSRHRLLPHFLVDTIALLCGSVTEMAGLPARKSPSTVPIMSQQAAEGLNMGPEPLQCLDLTMGSTRL
uniref:Uncharacterized protein n=1 Tax=Timema cristinae TaxID=61476 RepID=A0A7R9DFL1_TIMCR|nr:unnamed protein product [Timema cristinae]